MIGTYVIGPFTVEGGIAQQNLRWVKKLIIEKKKVFPVHFKKLMHKKIICALKTWPKNENHFSCCTAPQ